MTEKVWKYRYKDTVKETEQFDPCQEKLVPHFTAEHLPSKGNFVIVYDGKNKSVCHIHSDVEIDELELIEENTTITKMEATNGDNILR